MSGSKNSVVFRGALQALCTVAGRRSSEKFANNVMSAIIKTLEKKYVFLKYVKIGAKISPDSVVVSSQIDSFDLSEMDVLWDALSTIKEHHPGEKIWIESGNEL